MRQEWNMNRSTGQRVSARVSLAYRLERRTMDQKKRNLRRRYRRHRHRFLALLFLLTVLSCLDLLHRCHQCYQTVAVGLTFVLVAVGHLRPSRH